MPIKLWIEDGLAFRELDGEITTQEIIDSCVAFFDHPDFQKGIPCLWDFRKASLAKIKLDDIYALRDFISRKAEIRGTGFKIAYIVSRDLEYGVGRMMETILEDGPANLRKVFRSMSEAVEWVKAPV